MKWDADARTYSVIYGLEADGVHEFKFADASWGIVNLGYNEVIMSDDADAETVTDKGGNMQVSVAKSTSYKFAVSFDDDGNEVVKVSEAPIYIRGGVTVTGWGADAGNQFGFIGTDDGNAPCRSLHRCRARSAWAHRPTF